MKVKQRSVCQTCRTRKLGCDGKRPECSQCVLTGRKCDGYQSDWTFIPQNDHAAKPSSASKQRKFQISTRQNKDKADLPVSSSSKTRRHFADVNQEDILGPQRPLSSLNRPLWDDLFGLVVRSYIPEDEMASVTEFSDSKRPRICGSWLAVLPFIVGKSDRDCVLKATIKALASSILHQNSQVIGSTSNSIESYGAAVRAVRKGFSVTGYAFHAAFIAAVMCLTLVEIMFPDSTTAMAAHAKGVEHLLQTQNLEQYSSGVLHKLFVGFRPILIIQAFQNRQSTFLSLESWLHIPFSSFIPSPMQSLLSEAAAIPDLLQKIDMLLYDSFQPGNSEVTKLLNSFTEALTHLKDWEMRFQQGYPEAYYWTQVSDTKTTDGLDTMWFPNVTMANVYTHFWAFCIVCLTEIDKLSLLFPALALETPAFSSEFELGYIKKQTVALSKQICMSIEYLMQDEMKLFGPASTFFPLQVAYQTFHMEEEGQRENMVYIEQAVDRLAKKGLQSAPNVVFSGSRTRAVGCTF